MTVPAVQSLARYGLLLQASKALRLPFVRVAIRVPPDFSPIARQVLRSVLGYREVGRMEVEWKEDDS